MDQERATKSGKVSTIPDSIDDAFNRMDAGVRSYFQRTMRELTDIKVAIDKVLAVAITDADGVITYVNERFCDLYKYSKEEVIGNTHRLLKSGEHDQGFYRHLWETITSGRIFETEIKNRAKDGSFYWAHMVIVPFMNGSGKPYQYVSFRTDITPMKEAEAQRLNLVKAEAAVQARDRFVSMAAHELKTPITSLQMVLDLLVRESKTQRKPDELVHISRLLDTAYFQTRRLTSIINDLLDVSRIAAGKLALNRELVDLGELVETLIANSKADFDAAGCEVSVDIQKPIQGVWDKARLEQVIINLLSNAMKYGRRRPIHIAVEQSGANAQIKVRDHGIGIPKDFQKKLFQRFERSDTAEHYKGIGLGLWITNQIVDAHRGRIRVESEEGQGSTFTVELPIREETPWSEDNDERYENPPEQRYA